MERGKNIAKLHVQLKGLYCKCTKVLDHVLKVMFKMVTKLVTLLVFCFKLANSRMNDDLNTATIWC